jgi:hypothetical protein
VTDVDGILDVQFFHQSRKVVGVVIHVVAVAHLA